MERLLRNRKVLREVVDDVLYLRSKVSSNATAVAALKEFVDLVEDKQSWLGFKCLLNVLSPMRLYLRLTE